MKVVQHYSCVFKGSFSISVLSGKIMFRDMHWVTEDYSVRVQLGLAIFRWWRPLTLKEITEGKNISIYIYIYLYIYIYIYIYIYMYIIYI